MRPYNSEVIAYREAAAKPGVAHICEVGLNVGHSAIVFLHTNPNDARYTVFDIGESWGPRVKGFVQYLFPGRIAYIRGDSMTREVSKYAAEIETDARNESHRCHLFSVGGDRGYAFSFQDLKNARDASVDRGYILVDYTTKSFPSVGNSWERAVAEGLIEEIGCTMTLKKVRGTHKGWCYGQFIKPKPSIGRRRKGELQQTKR